MALNVKSAPCLVVLTALVVAGCQLDLNMPETVDSALGQQGKEDQSADQRQSSGGTGQELGETSAEPDGPAPTLRQVSPTPAPAATEVEEQEPNDDFNEAQEIAAHAKVSAAISKEQDDVYRITIPEGKYDGQLTITVRETSEKLRPYLSVYNGDRTQLGTKHASDNTVSTTEIVTAVTAGKTYYVRLHGASEGAEYTLETSFEAVWDAFERNDTFEDAVALPLGQAAPLHLFAGMDTNGGRDKDMFKFNVPSDATELSIRIENRSTSDASQRHQVWVYDGDRARVGNRRAPNSQANLEYTLPLKKTGPYFLRVQAENAGEASQLTVSVK